MSPERRYSDEQIAAIFKMASEEQKKLERDGSHGVGLTLSELQEIGGETGISPEVVARAAASLEYHETETPQPTLLGFPTGVSKTIELESQLTDEEWFSLVAEFRDTFRAHGKVEQLGGLRSWRNGNLQISLEPTKNGSRLRMRTFKGDAATRLFGSMAGVALVGALMLFEFITGDLSSWIDMKTTAVLMAVLLVVLLPVFGLSKWAKTRGDQMDAIGKSAEKMRDKGERTNQESAKGRERTQAVIPESAEGIIPLGSEAIRGQLDLDSEEHQEGESEVRSNSKSRSR